VPSECATVWDEAGKDACFEQAARHLISASPGSWLARVPGKLAVTFDYFGAGPWYLHASNAAALDDRWKLRLGALETVTCRLLLLGALHAGSRQPGARRRARAVVALAGAALAVTVHAWVSYGALALAVVLRGRRALARATIAETAAAVVVATTAAVHSVFFGAGRYGLVVVPFVTAMAFASNGSSGPRASEDT
jgi:hypothetical protein